MRPFILWQLTPTSQAPQRTSARSSHAPSSALKRRVPLENSPAPAKLKECPTTVDKGKVPSPRYRPGLPGTAPEPAPRRSERGAALLEAAFVVPIFLALLLAGIEGGFVFYERLSVANMSLAGARSASGQGSETLADYHALRSIQASFGGMTGGQLSMIVVYRATGPESRVPVACKTSSVATSCNRYLAADLALDSSEFGCTGPPGPAMKIDNSWCPTSRKTALTGAGGPPDYVGVYVEAQHQDLTGLFGDTITLRADTVFRLEPRTLT